MASINFGNPKGKHKCYAERMGEYVVFRCPVCDDFEQKIHLPTGKLTTVMDPDNPHKHYGSHIPAGIDSNLYHPN